MRNGPTLLVCATFAGIMLAAMYAPKKALPPKPPEVMLTDANGCKYVGKVGIDNTGYTGYEAELKQVKNPDGTPMCEKK